jgi:hypothetical protein
MLEQSKVAVAVVTAVGVSAGAAGTASASAVAAVEAVAACAPQRAIDARPPPVRYDPAPWRRETSARLARRERPEHVGYDGFARAGAPQQVAARFTYDGRGLEDEAVEVFAWRGSRWERLGEARTSVEDQRVVLPSGAVSDERGTVVVRVPDAQRLPVGLNRVRFVVRGDGSWTDALLSVVDPATRVVVSDVDGTLTSGESAEFFHRLGLRGSPSANPGAAAALWRFAARGYQVFYLTGRDARATADTRAWLARNGFPPGVLRLNERAGFMPSHRSTTEYKTAALRGVAGLMGHPVDVGFGNTGIDVAAYQAAAIPAVQRFFYRYDGPTAGGVRNPDYRALASVFERIPACARAAAP